MPTHKQPLVFIVVLGYKSSSVTQRCLLSLRRLTYPNYRIVVIDNDSNDESVKELACLFPNLTVIQSGCNWGYSGGNNLGFEYAIANGADYVLVLNPDTELANPVFIEETISYLSKESYVGIAGPRVFFQNTGKTQNTVLFPPGFWRNLANWFAYRIAPDSFELCADAVVDAQVLNGVCLLIRSDCLAQAGLFDENIFMYIEDADMDYRARQSGWRIQYLPIDSVTHLQKQEGYSMTGEVSFLLKRNSVYYLFKIGKLLDASLVALFFLFLLFVRGLLKFDFVQHNRLCVRLVAAFYSIISGKYDSRFGYPFTEHERKQKERSKSDDRNFCQQ